MYRVAMNVAIHNLKMTNRKVSTIPLDEQFINFQDIDNSEIEKKWELLRRHIESLNLLDKGIIILYLDNKSHEEIAHIIGISKSNVGTKLSRIKEKLKKQILNS
jgi:RNA polymerase sigma-70 factor (ECF subfamily)